jgi:hypothetical protein
MPNHYPNLNPEKALIWRIVHRDNLPWILDNGLHCGNSDVRSPHWVNIGNQELIDKRSQRTVPLSPEGTLSDYVPFYFTPFSPMMYNIYTGRSVPQMRNHEIIILVSTLHRVKELGHLFLFTDRHAYSPTAVYYDNLRNLENINWPILQARNFQKNPDDPLPVEQYQAEALIYQYLPVNALIGVICYTDGIKSSIQNELQASGVNLEVYTKQEWYFSS